MTIERIEEKKIAMFWLSENEKNKREVTEEIKKISHNIETNRQVLLGDT